MSMVGPKGFPLFSDDAVYDLIPLKKEVKATVSGIYITKVTGVRGPLEKPQGKKSFRARMQEKAKKANAELDKEEEKISSYLKCRVFQILKSPAFFD